MRDIKRLGGNKEALLDCGGGDNGIVLRGLGLVKEGCGIVADL